MEGLTEEIREVTEALQRSLLVYGLNSAQIQPIAALGQKTIFSAGEHIILEGTKESDLFVIIEGVVKTLTNDGDILNEIRPGGIFGEISFVDAGPRHCHAVAEGYVTAIKFPAKELRMQLCADRTSGFIVLSNLARLLAARLRNADHRLDHLMDHEHDCWGPTERC